MDNYKIETIIATLICGIGVLWHQLIKQVNINRTDQKEFSKVLERATGLISECTEVIRDFKEDQKHERNK
jgi:hypothetical protein